MPDAGWYRDLQDRSVEEYWDGRAWSGVRRPSGEQSRHHWGQRPVRAPHAPGPDGSAPSRRRMRVLLGAAVVVVLVAAGVVTAVLLRSSGAPALTYDGKQIASPDLALTRAERAVTALVAREHGRSNRRTRCYYAQPNQPTRGSSANDVTDRLLCGPVLFVDGTRTREYLPVALRADTSGRHAVLTPETSGLRTDEVSALPSGVTLVRPDGANAPAGDGGLTVPPPPPAARNSIVATSLTADEAPTASLDALMAARTRSVTLRGAGYITRYGTGTSARSAPAGQRLVAFRISAAAGPLGSEGPRPTLVAGGTSRAIPSTSPDEWDVAAVPARSAPVIRLAADGYTQTLALPSGRPGADNIQVLARSSTSVTLDSTFSMHSTLAGHGSSERDTLAVELGGASLYFWPPLHPTARPTSTRSAFLSVDATYTNPSEPGRTIGFAPGLLRLELPDGTTVRARNLAGSGQVYDVFTVPADYTTGTLVIGGSTALGHGVEQTLKETRRIGIAIA